MATAGDQVKGALRLIGQLAEGEEPSVEAQQDGLSGFNQMIDSWSTERLSVYTTQDQTFTWPASTSSRTFGPSGDFVGNRPILIDDSSYFVDSASGISYNLTLINEAQYNSIALKTVTSTYPQLMWVEMGNPDVTLTVYPVPTQALSFHLVSVLELTQPATWGTTLAFPPGYLRAFRYNLACELAPEFGVEPSVQVMRVAMSSKRNIKRINNPGDILSLPALMASNHNRYNIFADN